MKNQYTGPATIFRHDKNGRTYYSVAMSRVNSAGEKLFAYKDVQFRKGVELMDRCRIDIRNAWETFYINKDGNAVFYIFIADFTYAQPDQYQQPQQYQAPAQYQNQGYQQQYVPQYQQQYAPQYQQPQQYQAPAQYQRPQQPAQQPAPQPQPQPQQTQAPENPADSFEAIDEQVPF